MGRKIAMIGAGSVVFCKTLMADILATPALEGSEFALMSRTEPKLRAMEEFGHDRDRVEGVTRQIRVVRIAEVQSEIVSSGWAAGEGQEQVVDVAAVQPGQGTVCRIDRARSDG